MNKYLLLLITMLLLSQMTFAQSRAYGVKGGLTLGTQKWEGQDQDPLFSYHGVASMESVPEDNSFSLFAQVGYHVKGSAWRNSIFTNIGGGGVSVLTRKFKFQNIALTLGFKKNFKQTDRANLYYLFGVRGDYTVGTNLDEYEAQNEFFNAPVYPFDEAVRKINYGATIGAGTEFPLTEFVSGIMEVTISPDFSDQYRQGAFTANTNSQGGGSSLRNYPERKIRNLVFEVSFGFRFLHKIEYVD